MKVTFVHLGREHLGVEWLSAALKVEGLETSLACDPGLFTTNDNTLHLPRLAGWLSRRDRILEAVVRETPDLVAFTAYTGTYRWAADMAAEVRKRWKEATIVFGGVHPSLVPERVLADGIADFVVVGEGEGALLDLVEALGRGVGRLDIPNTCCTTGGQIVRNPLRPPVDVNALPFPDKELFRHQVSYRDDYMIMTSRGCPYRCSYCCEWESHRLYDGRFLRRRSVEHVMAELHEAKRRYGFREVMFFDSVLFTDKEWLGRLMDRFRSEIGVPFRCEGHVNLLDREVASCLKRAGCYCVEFGLQSMNERVRREVLLREESQTRVTEALRVCDEVGLKYDVDLIFDLPGEALEDLEAAATFFARARSLNRLKAYNLTYFPRTPIVEIAREQGILGAGQVEAIERGEMPGDFFHRDSLPEGTDRRSKAALRFLFKAVPLLPASWVERLVRRRPYALFSRVPRAVSLGVEIAVALKNRDHRYTIHARRYARFLLGLVSRRSMG